MTHRTRHEQKELPVRKGNNTKVRTTKVHKPRPAYDRNQKRHEIEDYLSQGEIEDLENPNLICTAKEPMCDHCGPRCQYKQGENN